MRTCSPALFYDAENHIWRFYVNDNKDLMYSIMYAEDKWTKENKIDNDVLDFAVDLDNDNKIYIIYSTESGEIRYCIWDENKCFGKTIYKCENDGYEMTELSVISIDKLMHIFFIGKSNINKNQCSLIHLYLNKDERFYNTIDTMLFLENAFCHYEVQNMENGNLSIIYIKHQESEGVINFVEYKNNKWSRSKRLYGIIGNSINFGTLLQIDKTNIMNLSKEGSINYLEHVLIEADGKMKSFKIHETSRNPTNYSLMEIGGVLWAIWSDGKDVFTASYSDQWSKPNKLNSGSIDNSLKYKYLSLSNKNNNIKCKYILGTNYPEINLLLPNYGNDNIHINEVKEKIILETKGELKTNMDEEKTGMNKELLFLQKNIRDLEKELINLQIKYQQKLRILDESEDTFSKLTNAKKKAEEKLNVISQIQQDSMKRLKVMEVEKISMDVVIIDLTNKSEILYNQYVELREQKVSKDDAVTELKNKLRQITSEKEELSQDLKYEKNIGIVDRIFKKRSER